MLSGFKQGIKSFFCSVTPGFIRRGIISDYAANAKLSYAQEGEDILLSRMMGDISKPGFFIDIGAHHPQLFSNTYKLYLAGWRGINIDAMPGSMQAFNALRKEDINLEVPVADSVQELDYYIFNHPELNSFSKEQAEHWTKFESIEVVQTVKLRTSTFEAIVQEHAPGRTVFDLLSIDVEGLDFAIINTINFNKYSFRFIVVEDKPDSVLTVMEGPVYQFLTAKNYKLVSKLYYSSIYTYVGA